MSRLKNDVQDFVGCFIILPILAIGFMILLLIEFIDEHPGFSLCVAILVVVVIAFCIYCNWSTKKDEERKRVNMETRLRNEVCQIGFWNIINNGVSTSSINETNKSLNEILLHPIIIDKSIWIDNLLQEFWCVLLKLCKQKNIKVFVLSDTFNEITKNNGTSEQGIQLAQKRMIDFSNAGLLELVQSQEAKNKKAPFVEQDIIKTCQHLFNNKKFNAENTN